MTKINFAMTSAFRRIREDCLSTDDSKIETIRKLGNTLLNL